MFPLTCGVILNATPVEARGCIPRVHDITKRVSQPSWTAKFGKNKIVEVETQKLSSFASMKALLTWKYLVVTPLGWKYPVLVLLSQKYLAVAPFSQQYSAVALLSWHYSMMALLAWHYWTAALFKDQSMNIAPYLLPLIELLMKWNASSLDFVYLVREYCPGLCKNDIFVVMCYCSCTTVRWII